jgi:Xaa-Pro dipeptidase
MRSVDPRRLADIQTQMAELHLDALLVRLGENMLPLTGYWPGLWLSAALVLPDGEAIVICPDLEADLAGAGWAKDVRTFPCWRFGDPEPEASLIKLLKGVAADHHVASARIGYEGGFDMVGPAHVALEQPAAAPVTVRRIAQAALGAEDLVDATAALYAIRAVKTEAELARLRVAAEIAAFGLAAFCQHARAGHTEIEVAAAIEQAVMVQGTGYKGTRVARACAQVTAGPDTAGFWGYPVSRPRPIEADDMVVVEMGVVADGFWADVARCRVAGRPSESQLGAAEAVCAAQDAAAAAARPGVTAAAVDAASHQALLAHGFEPYVVHSLGHGLGFRYHEPTPWLDPQSGDVLAEGMVLAMEPGIYWPGAWGVRMENNAIVTTGGLEPLTPFPRDLS